MTFPQTQFTAPPAENPMLAAIFNSNLLCIAVLSHHGRFLSMNESFCRLFDCEREAMLGKHYGFLFPKNEIHLPGEEVSDGISHFVTEHCVRNGEVSSIKISYEQVEWDGRVACFLTALNITNELDTAQKQALEKSNKEALINNIDDLVWSVNRKFKLIACNEAFSRYIHNNFGVVVKAGDDLMQKGIFPEAMLTGWKGIYESVLKGETFRKEVFTPCVGLAHSATWWDTRFNPVYKKDMVVGIACYSRNITEIKAVQEQLSQKKFRLAQAQGIAIAGSWDIDLKKMETCWSDETFRIMGMEPSADAVSIHQFLTIVHPEDRGLVETALLHIHDTTAINHVEHRIITQRGEIKYLEQRWQFHMDESGQPTSAVGTCQDITSRKDAERRLQESENLYRSVIEQANDTICIADSSMKFIDVNNSGCKAFGYTRDEVLQLHVWDVLFAEDLAENPFQSSSLKAGETIAHKRRIKRKDGSGILVELSGKAMADGKIIYFGRDITEREIAERKLKESIERYDLISRATNDMVWDWDLSTGEVYRNQEGWRKIFGSGDAETGSIQDWDGRIHPDDLAHVQGISHETLKSGKDFFEMECRVIKDDGSVAFILDRGYIIRDATGKAIRITGATQNITSRKLVEQQLVKEELRYRLLVQSGSDLVSIINDSGNYTYCSPALKRILGYEPENMLGKSAFSFIHPIERRILRKRLLENVPGKFFKTIPFRFRNSSGEWRWLESNITDMRNHADVQGFVINSRDVTDRVMAQEEIKKLSIIARETVNAVVITNPAGNIIWVNEAFSSITEYSPEEVIGKKAISLLQGEETNAASVSYIQQQIKQLKPFTCDVINYTRSGKKFWLRIQGQPQFNEKGKLKYFFAMETDITREKESEEILRSSEERYRYLFNNNPASIIIWDLENYSILETNDTAEHLYGYSREGFLQTGMLELRPASEHKTFKSFAAAAKNDIGFRAARTWLHHNSRGEAMYMNIISHRIVYKGRDVMLAMGINVTDKLLLEQMLEKERLVKQTEVTQTAISAQEQERQELGRELHDNINQILASSLLYLGLAKSRMLNDHPFMNQADSLIQSAIREVRNLSHSLIPPSLTDSNLLEALEGIATNIRQAGGVTITLQTDGFKENVVPAKIKLALFRIVQEQVNNILKHAAAHHITLSLQMQDHFLTLSIKDDGMGFDTDTKRGGVGLINIKTRASLFNGITEVVSSPGEGCELRVTIDFMPQPAALENDPGQLFK